MTKQTSTGVATIGVATLLLLGAPVSAKSTDCNPFGRPSHRTGPAHSHEQDGTTAYANPDHREAYLGAHGEGGWAEVDGASLSFDSSALAVEGFITVGLDPELCLEEKPAPPTDPDEPDEPDPPADETDKPDPPADEPAE